MRVFPPPNVIPRGPVPLNNAQGTYLLIASEWLRAFWLQICKPDRWLYLQAAKALDRPGVVIVLKVSGAPHRSTLFYAVSCLPGALLERSIRDPNPFKVPQIPSELG